MDFDLEKGIASNGYLYICLSAGYCDIVIFIMMIDLYFIYVFLSIYFISADRFYHGGSAPVSVNGYEETPNEKDSEKKQQYR